MFSLCQSVSSASKPITSSRVAMLFASRWAAVRPAATSAARDFSPCSDYRTRLPGSKMPVPAQRTQVGLATALHAEQRRRVKRITLGLVTALADAHALAFVASWLFHGSDQPRDRASPRPALDWREGGRRSWYSAISLLIFPMG